LVKDVVVELDDGSQVQELQCSTSSNVSNVQHAMKTAEVVTEISDSTISSSALQDNVLEVESELSTKKHSISIEVRC
jgi:activating signal cointegrator complex subunit 1